MLPAFCPPEDTMPAPREPRPTQENRLLAALPSEEQQRVLPKTDLVSLGLGQSLYERGHHIDYVYFFRDGVASLLIGMADGESVEAATTGNEGVVGLPLLLGT